MPADVAKVAENSAKSMIVQEQNKYTKHCLLTSRKEEAIKRKLVVLKASTEQKIKEL